MSLAPPTPSAPIPAGRGIVVAGDGPSGSGKSSVSKGVARRLGLRYLDTGAPYRAMTFWMLQKKIEVGEAFLQKYRGRYDAGWGVGQRRCAVAK